MGTKLHACLTQICNTELQCEWNHEYGGIPRVDFFKRCSQMILDAGREIEKLQRERPHDGGPIFESWQKFTAFSLEESYPAGPQREIRDPGVRAALINLADRVKQHTGIALQLTAGRAAPFRPIAPPFPLVFDLREHMPAPISDDEAIQRALGDFHTVHQLFRNNFELISRITPDTIKNIIAALRLVEKVINMPQGHVEFHDYLDEAAAILNNIWDNNRADFDSYCRGFKTVAEKINDFPQTFILVEKHGTLIVHLKNEDHFSKLMEDQSPLSQESKRQLLNLKTALELPQVDPKELELIVNLLLTSI